MLRVRSPFYWGGMEGEGEREEREEREEQSWDDEIEKEINY